MAYSRRTSLEESKHKKRAWVYILLTIITVVLLLFLGIPLIIKYAGFITDVGKSSDPVQISDDTPPAPPRFDDIPEATSKLSIDLTGNSEPGATLILYLNGDTEEVLVGGDGQFTHDFGLNKGSNKISAIVRDTSGNESQETETYTVVYDNTAPDLSIISPANGDEFFGSKERQVVIEGLTDMDSEVRINGRIVAVDDGSFTYATTLSDGENEFVFIATDKADNSTEEKLTLMFTP